MAPTSQVASMTTLWDLSGEGNPGLGSRIGKQLPFLQLECFQSFPVIGNFAALEGRK